MTKKCPECALINSLGNAPHIPIKDRGSKEEPEKKKEEENGKEESD